MKPEPMTITVRITAEDHVTPALRRIHRRLWWMKHGEEIMRTVTVLLAVTAFILGRLSA